MKKILLIVMLVMFLSLGAMVVLPANAQKARPGSAGGYGGWCSAPPRFQIFYAPRPYGGMIMVDTKTGDSWQRIIVNTPKGIQVRWMKLDRQGPRPGETILWDLGTPQ